VGGFFFFLFFSFFFFFFFFFVLFHAVRQCIIKLKAIYKMVLIPWGDYVNCWSSSFMDFLIFNKTLVFHESSLEMESYSITAAVNASTS